MIIFIYVVFFMTEQQLNENAWNSDAQRNLECWTEVSMLQTVWPNPVPTNNPADILREG